MMTTKSNSRKYLILSPYLPTGKILTNTHLKWHERLRIKIAKWLLLSVPKPDRLEITTTSGVARDDDPGSESGSITRRIDDL